jgi:protein-L-isoaspartate(D-aspartate) O-methyltransferase
VTDRGRDWLLKSLEEKEISDPAVLGAIAEVPRELFISEPHLRQHAYDDAALPIECRQTISQPFVVAYMTERLRVMRHHGVLEIGTGSGYQTAILAHLARHVYTIERHPELHELAMARLRSLGLSNVTAIVGDGTKGWPEPRLFDRILVTAGSRKVPKALVDQLAPSGLMLIPLGARRIQRLTLITCRDGRVEAQKLLPVRFVPLLGDG